MPTAALSSVPIFCRRFASTKANKRRSTDVPIKYASTPQLQYGPQQAANPWARLPQGSQPMSSLPDYTPCIVHESNGQAHYAMKRRESVRKLAPFRNWKTGETSWREDGTQIHAVAWRPIPPRQKR